MVVPRTSDAQSVPAPSSPRAADPDQPELPGWLRPAQPCGSVLTLHVQPGASRTAWAGLHGDALKVRVQARPVEGAANAALIAFLADTLALSRQEVVLVRGEKSRQKTFTVPLPPDRVASIIQS